MTKEHTPEEIKYRLSDLGVQIGNIAIEYIIDLEKENAELKEALKNDKVCKCSHYLNFKDLEKENAELKVKLTAIRNAKDKFDMSKNKSIIKASGAEYTLFCDLERILEDWQEDDELTKAKELLKLWLQTSKASGCDNINIVTDTEQFLKESE